MSRNVNSYLQAFKAMFVISNPITFKLINVGMSCIYLTSRIINIILFNCFVEEL